MKKYIVSIAGIFWVLLSYAQNAELNHQKYWYYRYRLLNNFILSGPCVGCGIPASQYAFNVISQNGIYDHPGNAIKWGDATIELGWYLGVLATEYRLLKDNSQDVTATVEELAYALVALNRLDEQAEIYWGGVPSLNGFFIRDDIPEDFFCSTCAPIERFEHFNSGLISKYKVYLVKSDFADQMAMNKPPIEMSHDQVWHLLMGLALINRFVDDSQQAITKEGIVDFENGIYHIKEEANRIVDRITNHIIENNWQVKNPVINECIQGVCDERPQDCFLDLACGSNAQWLSYGAGEAACKATFPITFDPGGTLLIPPYTCNDYHNAFSLFVNYTLWQSYQSPIELVVNLLSTDDYLLQLIAAIGNSWHSGLPPALVNTTAVQLGIRALPPFRNFQNLPLLRQVLHGGINTVSNNTYIDLLDTAPCEGPYNFGDENSATYEWSSTNRFYHPERRGVDNPDFPGEYNGLDYMLLHNMYYYIQENEYNAVNLIDRDVTINFPTGIGPFEIGSHGHPATITAFNSITASNTIKQDGDVTYRAGVEINLKPGFEVEAGVDFYAYIDPFECASDGGYQKVVMASADPVSFLTPTSYVYGNKKGYSEYNRSYLQKNERIIVSPNPTSGTITLQKENGENIDIYVYDLLGKEIFRSFQNNASRIYIDISGFPKGVYFLKVQDKAEIYTNKIILQ